MTKAAGGKPAVCLGKSRQAVCVVDDPITGLPMISAGPDFPALSKEDVDEILADFP
jgi:hypothetical protein